MKEGEGPFTYEEYGMEEDPYENAEQVALNESDDHGTWLISQRVGERGSKYAMIYECACGCGETWQPENELF